LRKVDYELQRTQHRTVLFGKTWKLFCDSGLALVALGFLILAVADVITSYIGPDKILHALNSNSFGILLSSIVYDSVGTILGLLGVVWLFAPVLLGTQKFLRKPVAAFFMFGSIGVGVASTALWNYYYNLSSLLPYGASSIAISAQSIIFTMAIIGVVELWLNDESVAWIEPYWRKSLMIIYATLIGTTLWFVLFLEPIFVPTTQYNWRVHEIAFLGAIVSTLVFYCTLHLRDKSV